MCSRVRLLTPHLSSVRLIGTAASRTATDKPANHLSATLAFDDPSAFKVKSWGELFRTLGIFRFCSYPVLVNNSGKVRKEFNPLLKILKKAQRCRSDRDHASDKEESVQTAYESSKNGQNDRGF